MPIRAIIKPFAQIKTKMVDNFLVPHFKQAISDLVDTFAHLRAQKKWGEGLAANQIQYPSGLASDSPTANSHITSHQEAVYYPSDFIPPQAYVIAEEKKLKIYVNSQFTPLSFLAETKTSEEENFLAKYLKYYFPSYQKIRVTAFNEDGQKIIEDVEEPLATVHQQQIAHLQGFSSLGQPELSQDDIVDLLVWAEEHRDTTVVPETWIIPGKLKCLSGKPDFSTIINWCQRKLSSQVFAVSEKTTPKKEVAVVIGGNRGIGLGFVKYYLSRPEYLVIATYRDVERIGELKALKKHHPDKIRLYHLDVRNETSIYSFSDKVKEKINMLVLNAGIMLGPRGVYPPNNSLQEARDLMEVNTYAHDNIMRALYLKLLHPNSCTVYISSTLGYPGGNTTGRSHYYRASKTASNMLMQNWNAELAKLWLEEIKGDPQSRPCVFPISPGLVQTDMAGPNSNAPLTVEQSVNGMAAVINTVRCHKQCSFYLYNGEILERYPDPLVITQLVQKSEETKLNGNSNHNVTKPPLAGQLQKVVSLYSDSVDSSVIKKKEQLVVVIGGNRGIGLGFVQHYMSMPKYSVIATYHDAEKMDAIKALQKRYPERIRLYHLDVRDEVATKDFANTIEGYINILILNAGIMGGSQEQNPLKSTLQESKRIMEVNTYAHDNLMRSLHLKLLQPHSCAVYVSSTLSHPGSNLRGWYHIYRASKAAGNILMQNWNIELARIWLEKGGNYKIRPCIFPMSPGVVQTEMAGQNAPLTVAQSVSGMVSVINAVRAGNDKNCSLRLYDGSILETYPAPLIITNVKKIDIASVSHLPNSSSFFPPALNDTVDAAAKEKKQQTKSASVPVKKW